MMITRRNQITGPLPVMERLEQPRQREELQERIARGERAIEEGRVFSSTQAKQYLSRWFK